MTEKKYLYQRKERTTTLVLSFLFGKKIIVSLYCPGFSYACLKRCRRAATVKDDDGGGAQKTKDGERERNAKKKH